MTKYFIMMGIRVVCFVLMVVIAPYGWHTAVLAVGAVFLPYLAVVAANVGEDQREPAAESPLQALEARTPPPAPVPADKTPAAPLVIEVRETRPE